MTQKKWKLVEVRYCEHVGHEVKLEAQMVDTPEHLPDQPPHILAHRCSNAIECNKIEKMACVYCGTNPNHNPL